MADQKNPSRPEGPIVWDTAIPGPSFPAPMVLTPSQARLADDSRETAAQFAHDKKVAAYINSVLDTYKNQWSTVAQNLDNAQSFVTDERKKNGSDAVMRDAEYYLKTRAWTAEHKYQPVKIFYSNFWVAAALVWNGLKYVVDPIFPTATQSNKGNPNSEPGGLGWATKGANDGLDEDGSLMGRPRDVGLEPGRVL